MVRESLQAVSPRSARNVLLGTVGVSYVPMLADPSELARAIGSTQMYVSERHLRYASSRGGVPQGMGLPFGNHPPFEERLGGSPPIYPPPMPLPLAFK